MKRIDLWNTRTTSSGRFEEEKRRGVDLSRVRPEDGWRLSDYDKRLLALAFIALLATACLIYLSWMAST